MTDPALIGPIDAPDLHVMTFNIRRRITKLSAGSPDLWATRAPLVQRLLGDERPSLLGVQEALPDQALAVRVGLGPQYRMIGYGRSRTKSGEGCPLYFDTERLTLLDWEQVALSDSPDAPGSATWGNLVPRVAVSGRFQDVATGVEFLAVNTHFDHLSRRSRIRSAQAVGALVRASGLPGIVTGDFNTGEWTKPYLALTDGGLRDTWTAARWRLSPEWGTFSNYREPRYDRKRIDWILTSDAVAVEKVGINVRRFDGAWPSDHAPVQAVVRIGADESPARPNATEEYLDAEHPTPETAEPVTAQDNTTEPATASPGPEPANPGSAA